MTGRGVTSAAALFAAALAVAACDQALKVKNVAPRVSAVTAATPDGDTLRLLFWVQDHEEEPVDVAAAWADESTCAALDALLADGEPPPDPEDAEDLAEAGVDLRPLAEQAGSGQHSAGLTSGRDWPGLPHVLAWNTEGVDAERVCVYLLPDDRNGRRGEPALSPVFDRATGFGEPIPGGAPAADAGATD